MIFASLVFIFIFLPLYLLVDRRLALSGTKFRNCWLLIMSLLFYVWGEAANVFLLLAMGVINYYAAILIERAERRRKWLLGSFILINLSVLFFFKYLAWGVAMMSDISSWLGFAGGGEKFHIAIPLGISFFTFHAISYLMDVSSSRIKAARSATTFLTYFCMFPHLVAGPIVRYAQVETDLAGRKRTKGLFSFGVYRFLLGLNKKVLIANTAAAVADSAFSLSALNTLGCADAWIGVIAYAIQIYFDFSGYSDMAIGLAAMAGFHFEENFCRPYSCTSIRDFWRRWHISLSTWLRDYLYIPLGGSRAGALKTYRNLFIIFVVCGIWHGASFTFLVWGIWHGLFMVMERLKADKFPSLKAPVMMARAYALTVVLLGWVFFRAESLGDAVTYLGTMLCGGWHSPYLLESWGSTCVLIGAVIFCLLPDKWLPSPTSKTPADFPTQLYVWQALLAVESVALLAQGNRNPFIYFNF